MFATFSCTTTDWSDELTGDASEGGLATINNIGVGYVVGNDATYTVTGSVYQGNVQTNTIDVYKSFTSATTGSTSNEILLTTMPISNTTIGDSPTFEFSFTYEELIAGLEIDGSPLPENDADLSIGDFWTLKYVSSTSIGNKNTNAAKTKVSVGTRFAGFYYVDIGIYYRIGVLRDDVAWPAEMLIESVDAVTYRCVEYFGAFDGNVYYFEIDVNDKITYPDETPDGDPQTGNGEPMITCQSAPNDLSNVPCDPDSNFVIRDDLNGEDQLVMTFGYFTGGSGPREFYQVLRKNVTK
jgi:hypothetical protein